mmetsp:Transcript_63057/g.179238  ORF Transcript_63057/g.179238 Transcript_63057/m.179238 type:complete len:256 (+) Transcript_63057:565-1332(+)
MSSPPLELTILAARRKRKNVARAMTAARIRRTAKSNPQCSTPISSVTSPFLSGSTSRHANCRDCTVMKDDARVTTSFSASTATMSQSTSQCVTWPSPYIDIHVRTDSARRYMQMMQTKPSGTTEAAVQKLREKGSLCCTRSQEAMAAKPVTCVSMPDQHLMLSFRWSHMFCTRSRSSPGGASAVAGSCSAQGTAPAKQALQACITRNQNRTSSIVIRTLRPSPLSGDMKLYWTMPWMASKTMTAVNMEMARPMMW